MKNNNIPQYLQGVASAIKNNEINPQDHETILKKLLEILANLDASKVTNCDLKDMKPNQ